jgi:UDP-2-acetamido-3-amino-2,3-dideoxy-glucuronate N-acetyltransferase
MEKEYFSHESAVIDEGAVIGKGSKIWHFCHVMGKSIIGRDCNLGQNVFIAENVILGNNVKVQNNVSIYSGVVCGDDVFLGPSMVFTNIKNPRSAVVRKGEYTKTMVKQGASVGANATIVCGNEIGRFAFIAAGAVVTTNVPDYALMIGCPAKLAGWMSEYGHRLHFDETGKATCPESGEEYLLSNGEVNKI